MLALVLAPCQTALKEEQLRSAPAAPVGLLAGLSAGATCGAHERARMAAQNLDLRGVCVGGTCAAGMQSFFIVASAGMR